MKKKLILIFMLITSVQIMAETVIIGKYNTKGKMYKELSYKIVKEINLDYTLPTNKKEIVTYKSWNYEILVSKTELLNLYNKNKTEKISDIKNVIISKKPVPRFIYNTIAELVENNKAVIYDKKNKKEIKKVIKTEYDLKYYYDNGRGSGYNGSNFFLDKDLKNKVMTFDKETEFGIMLHATLTSNPYNRELKDREKEEYLNSKIFEVKKELYEKSLRNPNVEQEITYYD